MTETTHKDQDAWDVLTTALEGGYTEEFQVIDYKRDETRDHVITWAKVRLAEGYEATALVDGVAVDLPLDWTETLDAATIRTGFRRYTAWVRENDPAHRTYLGQQWAIAHDEDATWADLDAIGADAVLQFACFGEVIFG